MRPAWCLILAAAPPVLPITGAHAAGGILGLGKPTASLPTNSHFPIGGFRRAKLRLPADYLPELLWIGTAWPGDALSAAERWPLIKALEQFGSFSGMAIAPRPCWAEPRTSLTACPTTSTSAR